MGLLSGYKEALYRRKKERMFQEQIREEAKARELERKARFSKALTKRLERQKKAREDIRKMKELKAERRREILKPFTQTLSNIRTSTQEIKKKGNRGAFNKEAYKTQGTGLNLGMARDTISPTGKSAFNYGLAEKEKKKILL